MNEPILQKTLNVPDPVHRRFHREDVHIVARLYSFRRDDVVTVVELAEGGLAVLGATNFLPREEVSVTFRVPYCDMQVSAQGVVIWTKEDEKLAGIAFTRIAETDKEVIVHWLKYYRGVAGECEDTTH